MRNNYIVPRYKSLIGSTEFEGADELSNSYPTVTYLVIPFDESNIVIAGSPDLAMWSRKGQEFTDDLFILEKYTKDFRVPNDKLWSILLNSTLRSFEDIIKKRNLGFEFFTNSNCLLLDKSKIEWLKGII